MYLRFDTERGGVDLVFTAKKNQKNVKGEASLEGLRGWGVACPSHSKVKV